MSPEKKQRHLIGSLQCYNLHKAGLLIFNCVLTGYASLLIVTFLSAKKLAFDCIKNHKCIYQEPNLDLIATWKYFQWIVFTNTLNLELQRVNLLHFSMQNFYCLFRNIYALSCIRTSFFLPIKSILKEVICGFTLIKRNM